MDDKASRTRTTMMQSEQSRLATILALLRGLVMVIAGLFALITPATAATVIVIAGGCLLIAEGILGLASHNYGAERQWPFWLALARSILAIIAGLALLASPYLATILTLDLLTTLIGLQAIVIGLIETVFVIRNRKQYTSIWRPLGAGLIYVVVGLLLVFSPYAAAVLLIQVGGALLVIFGLLQLSRTWAAVRRASGP
jgi:uncharacterized membrane protein HdeD (DUF308 family)